MCQQKQIIALMNTKSYLKISIIAVRCKLMRLNPLRRNYHLKLDSNCLSINLLDPNCWKLIQCFADSLKILKISMFINYKKYCYSSIYIYFEKDLPSHFDGPPPLSILLIQPVEYLPVRNNHFYWQMLSHLQIVVKINEQR